MEGRTTRLFPPGVPNRCDPSRKTDTLTDATEFLEGLPESLPDEAAFSQVEYMEVVCCSSHSAVVSDVQRSHRALVMHNNPYSLDENQKVVSWPSSTHLVCWHDGFPFDTVPVCVPVKKSKTGMYVVKGNFCSANCALKHIQMENRYDNWQRMYLFQTMMKEVFHMDITGCKAAPDRYFLDCYGGYLTIEQFRAKSLGVDTHVVTPPFIMYPIFLEEVSSKMDRQRTSTGHVLRGLRRPVKIDTPAESTSTTPGMFEDFVRNASKEDLQQDGYPKQVKRSKKGHDEPKCATLTNFFKTSAQ